MRLIPLLLLATCASPGQRYVGTLTPEVPSDACRPSRASLVLRNDGAVFTPDEGTWTLAGPITGNSFTASRTARGSYATRVEARWTSTAAEGTYVTPRCTFRLAAEPR